MTPPSSDDPSPADSQASPACPACGAAIPADAPNGLCPACLAGAAANADTQTAPGTGSGASFTPPTVADIDALLPDFEVSELIGRGGMGAVYKARQVRLNRDVAIKVLPESIAADAAFAERFTREAHALAQLSHPNIITVHDVGAADGLCYIVMEFVEGANLRQVLESGKLAPKEALAIVVQLCEALQYAHDSGIVHRDIKPENILMTEKGQVKIADFGLVKLVGGGSPGFDVTLTATHQAMGTVQYMAPEQLSASGDADHRADIYSLGVVFYEMLTGEIPAGRFDPPSQRVAVDVRLDEVVLRALDGQPDRRYQSAAAIKTEVESIAGDESGQQQPPPLSSREQVPPSGPAPLTETAPVFSRKAIVGALWAPLFFVAFMSFFMLSAVEVTTGSEPPPPSGPNFAQWLSILFIGLPGAIAPIGTTVLGMVAISDIRHSKGRITGLPLAVADALLFPMILLFIVVIILSMTTVKIVVNVTGWIPKGIDANNFLGVMLLPSLIITAIIGFFIVRATWRAAKRPPGGE